MSRKRLGLRYWVGEILAVSALAAFVSFMVEAIGVDLIRTVALVIAAVAEGVNDAGEGILAREGLAFGIAFIASITFYVVSEIKEKRSNESTK